MKILQNLLWTFHIDISFNENGSKEEIIHILVESQTFEYAWRFALKASNNKVEYKALFSRLKLVKDVKAIYLKIFNVPN